VLVLAGQSGDGHHLAYFVDATLAVIPRWTSFRNV
jgi:hypothetical protein